MSRRLVIAGLAAVFSLPALAQQQNPAIPYPANPAPAARQLNPDLDQGIQQRQQRTQQGGAPQDTQSSTRQGQGQGQMQGQAQGQTGATARAGQQQSPAGQQYVQQMLAASTVSLQQSNFALSKAQNPRVKQFAEFETAEQNTLTGVLRSFADPGATASTTSGAQQAASTAPVLPPEDSATMERMSRAQPGAEFDRDYIAMQLQEHQEMLNLQENYLRTESGNHEMTNVARLARTMIQEHLALLQDIQKELGR